LKNQGVKSPTLLWPFSQNRFTALRPFSQNRFTADNHVTGLYPCRGTRWQKYVDPAAEFDKTVFTALGYPITLLYVANNSTR
jgi:hypothetical protein